MLLPMGRVNRVRAKWGAPIVLGLAASAGVVACEPPLDSLSADYGNELETGGTGGVDGTGGSGGSGGSAGSEPTPNTCSDEVQQPDESDVDCGGTSACTRCADGKNCEAADDCRSGYCHSGVCRAPACSDGVMNQDETDIDCGGRCAPARTCELGEGCAAASDCESQYCEGGVCADRCDNGARDGQETDVDCGGPTCQPCAVGDACADATDCSTELCLRSVCAEPSCTDNTRNQDETAADCGGVCAATRGCADGLACRVGADCASYLCSALQCVADDPVLSADWIDTFEDGDVYIERVSGRYGGWYAYGDSTGTRMFAVEPFAGRMLPASTQVIHTVGTGHTVWGAGLGLDLNNTGGSGETKDIYDASAYTGISFWARAAQPVSISVVCPDKNTEPAIGNCTTGVCDDHFVTMVHIGTTWQKYNVSFASLRRSSSSEPTTLARDGLVGIQFRAAANIDYELWIDNVAFRR